MLGISPLNYSFVAAQAAAAALASLRAVLIRRALRSLDVCRSSMIDMEAGFWSSSKKVTAIPRHRWAYPRVDGRGRLCPSLVF